MIPCAYAFGRGVLRLAARGAPRDESGQGFGASELRGPGVRGVGADRWTRRVSNGFLAWRWLRNGRSAGESGSVWEGHRARNWIGAICPARATAALGSALEPQLESKLRAAGPRCQERGRGAPGGRDDAKHVAKRCGSRGAHCAIFPAGSTRPRATRMDRGDFAPTPAAHSGTALAVPGVWRWRRVSRSYHPSLPSRAAFHTASP